MQLVQVLSVSGDVRLVADEQIGKGGVKIISGHGEVDATIATQLNDVVESLFGRSDLAGRYESEVLSQYISDVGASQQTQAQQAAHEVV